MRPIGIVIVTYNSEREIGASLDAALASGCDVVVVDNASTDRTCAEVRGRGAALIANPENRGFAGAMNQGVRALPNAFILALNPDAVLLTPLDALREVCERPDVAAAGGKLVGADGKPQAGFLARRFPTAAALICECLGVNRAWPRNPVNWHYRCLDLDLSAIREVDQPAGALLLFRRDVWQKLGGFDEGFHPLWFEDVDFCRRARNLGLRIYCVPFVVAKHTGGHSIQGLGVENRVLYWYRGLLRYTAKHLRPWEVRAVAISVVTGSLLRAAAALFSGRSRTSIAAYRRVVRLGCRYVVSGGAVGPEVRADSNSERT